MRALPRRGNLREKIGLINDVAMGPQPFLWGLIERVLRGEALPAGVRQDVVLKHLARVHTLTGILDPGQLFAFRAAHPDAPMPTSLVKLPADGAVVLSRYTEYPMLSGARAKRPAADADAFAMRVGEEDPPLSRAEGEYMRSRFPEEMVARGTLPWLTGAMCWTINPDNFYSRLAAFYGQQMIAGPSGSTDGCLEVLELFDDFNVRLATLCCAAWLCNRNDHSLWEVLLAALPYGLEYSSDEDAQAYVPMSVRVWCSVCDFWASSAGCWQ